jgi:serine/threonine protein kinase/tetratricopeptide (TPR) repeat protein
MLGNIIGNVAPRTGFVGTNILHYHVLNRLGGGGMGEVYLAEDTRLGRQVALKFLPPADTMDPEARSRLVREAQAAALLRSPHIAVTYDLLEYDDGIFIAMEYVQGELLSARIARGPMTLPDTLDVGLQVADALDEAHGHGIVHRDIKSSNLILTPRHLVKVLDFGLAKFGRNARPDEVQTMANVTMPGSMLGTLNYMSPEQLAGGVLDHRTDLFSLGVVLYEMLTARLPFHGNSFPEIADRILHAEPDAIARYNYEVPGEVETIVRKALEKSSDYRYQSARELYIDLFNVRRRLSNGDSSHRHSWRGPIDFSDPAAAMPVRPGSSTSHGSAVDDAVGQRSIAVLSFTNITGDTGDDWIGQGIAETLTADLKHVEGVSVIPREQIFDQLRTFSGVGHALDERQAIDLGRRVGAWWVLSGGYQHRGPRVRVTAYVIEVLSGRLANTLKLDGTIEQIFELQDDLVRQIAQGLNLGLEAKGMVEASKGETKSVEAYQAFSRGMLNLRLASRDSLERAIALFEQALEIDPNYAEAIAGLGGAYNLKAQFLSIGGLNLKAIKLLRRALEINPSLTDVKVRLGFALLNDRQVDEAIAVLREAVTEQPENAQAHGTLGRAYWVGRGQIPEAIRELEEAVALNPEAGYAYLQLASLYAMSGALQNGENAARAAIALQEQAMSGAEGILVVGAHSRLGYLHYLGGDYDKAIAEYRRELEFIGASDHLLRDRSVIEIHLKLASAFYRKGQKQDAQLHAQRAKQAFDNRVTMGADDPFTRYYMATLFAMKGDAETAAAHLDHAFAALPALTQWRVAHDPDFAGVREHPAIARFVNASPFA